jgi:hypothetical protein
MWLGWRGRAGRGLPRPEPGAGSAGPVQPEAEDDHRALARAEPAQRVAQRRPVGQAVVSAGAAFRDGGAQVLTDALLAEPLAVLVDHDGPHVRVRVAGPPDPPPG